MKQENRKINVTIQSGLRIDCADHKKTRILPAFGPSRSDFHGQMPVTVQLTEQLRINIIGAGLAGLSAAKTLTENGCMVRLISVQPSERAQSNLAEGGINASLDVMGEGDTVFEHYQDSMNGGCQLADPNMVMGLAKAAPGIVRSMEALGVPFHREDGHIIQRNFGGQKKKRTAYAKSSTGKVLTVALIDAVRKQEAKGRVARLCHHRFERLLLNGGECVGVQVFDLYEKRALCLEGPVIMACGGFNGMFSGLTTGTTANTGSAAAMLFLQGVRFGNLEFIQYHPTTVAITGKRLLISEAARGEGGRLFYFKEGIPEGNSLPEGLLEGNSESLPENLSGGNSESLPEGVQKNTTEALSRNQAHRKQADERSDNENKSAFSVGEHVGAHDKRCYFMEERYGGRGNLMPRDVVSREMAALGKQVYLDLSGLSEKVWEQKLSDLREEIIHYLAIDPKDEPVPVAPGIHYFMGGIYVDEKHRTNIKGLFAAGECACAYHGANRLGGNSLLGAIYGGQVAAASAAGINEDPAPSAAGTSEDPAANAAGMNENMEANEAEMNVNLSAGAMGTNENPAVSATGMNVNMEASATGTNEDSKASTAGKTVYPTELATQEVSSMRADELEAEKKLEAALYKGLGIRRDASGMEEALEELTSIVPDQLQMSCELRSRCLLAEAMLRSALQRKESRGAHTRLDYPKTLEEYHKTTIAEYDGQRVRISFQDIPAPRFGKEGQEIS